MSSTAEKEISIIIDIRLKLVNPSSDAFAVGDVWLVDEKGIHCRALFFHHFSTDELRHSIQDLQFEVRKHEGMRISGKIICLKKIGDEVYREKWSVNNSKLLTESENENAEKEKKSRAPRVPPAEKRRLIIEYYNENAHFPEKDIIYKEVPIGKFFDKMSTDGKSLIDLYSTVGAELPK